MNALGRLLATTCLTLFAGCTAELEVRVDVYQGDLVLSREGQVAKGLTEASNSLTALSKSLVDVCDEMCALRATIRDRGENAEPTPDEREALAMLWYARQVVLQPVRWVVAAVRDAVQQQYDAADGSERDALAAAHDELLELQRLLDADPTRQTLNDLKKHLEWRVTPENRSEKLVREEDLFDRAKALLPGPRRDTSPVASADYVERLRASLGRFQGQQFGLLPATDLLAVTTQSDGLSVLAHLALFAEKINSARIALETVTPELGHAMRHLADHGYWDLPDRGNEIDHVSRRVVYPTWRILRDRYPRLAGVTNFLLKHPDARTPREGSDGRSAASRLARHHMFKDVVAAQEAVYARLREGMDGASATDRVLGIHDLELEVEALRELENSFVNVVTTSSYLALEDAARRVRRLEGNRDDGANWEEVTTVRVQASGKANYVVMRDSIGNWQVKETRNDATELVNLAYGASAAVLDLAVSSGTGSARNHLRDAYAQLLQNPPEAAELRLVDELLDSFAADREEAFESLERVPESERSKRDAGCREMEALLAAQRRVLSRMLEHQLPPVADR